MNRTPAIPPRLLWGAFALVLAALLWWHAAIAAPFVISLVLAYALRPGVERLVAWGCPRALATALCLVLLVLVGATVLVLLVPIVYQLTPMLRTQLPVLLLRAWAVVAPWLAQWGVQLPSGPQAIQAEAMAFVQEHLSEWGGVIASSVLVGGGGLMSVLGWLVLVPVLTFYWLLDWARLMGHVRNLMPARWREASRALLAECDQVMGQYLRGQVLVMAVLALYYSVALSAAGFHLGLPIGLLTGLAICIPYLGYGLGLVLALLAGVLQFGAVSQGLTYPLVAVALVYGAGQVLESFFLTPRLVGERIGLHPLGVILALMLFGQWMGLWGVVIALPASALLMVLGHRLLHRYQSSAFYQGEPSPSAPSGQPD